jgi:hypothetical protein
MVKRCDSNAPLLFSDTDSLCYHLFTIDVYSDMSECIDLLDTSASPRSPPALYNEAMNAKTIGKMKEEYSGKAPFEFAGLLTYDDKLAKSTAKGVNDTLQNI